MNKILLTRVLFTMLMFNGAVFATLQEKSTESGLANHNIIGCDDNAKKAEMKCSKLRTLAEIDKDIGDIKVKLNDILEYLADLSKDKDSSSKIDKIKDSLRKLIDEDVLSEDRDVKVLESYKDHVLIEVQVGESLSKYAQKYYGDAEKYHKIVRANRDSIGKDLQIFIGDKLVIPLNGYKFKEEEIANSNIVVDSLDEAIFVGDEVNDLDGVDTVIPLDDETPRIEKRERHNSWIEVKIENGIDIYQLAERYYGDRTEYYHIYDANRDTIGSDLRLEDGMLIKVPITDNFRDRPIFIINQ